MPKWLVVAIIAGLAAPAAAQTAASAYAIEQGLLVMPQPIRFEPGDDVLTAQSAAGIAYLLGFLHDRPAMTLIRIETHGRAYADAGINQQLTEAQARRLGAAIKAAGGDCSRLVFAAFGDTKPVAAGRDPANDRVVIAMAAMRGLAIGGMPADGGGRVIADACR